MKPLPRIDTQKGFTLVETMATVVLLGLVGLMIFAGSQALLSISREGKLKAEGVTLLRAVTEDIAANPSVLQSAAGKGEQVYSAGIMNSNGPYRANYSVANTAYGVCRLEVKVIRDGKEIASNSVLVEMPNPRS